MTQSYIICGQAYGLFGYNTRAARYMGNPNPTLRITIVITGIGFVRVLEIPISIFLESILCHSLCMLFSFLT